MFLTNSYVESLESRQLLSASLNDAGLLRISGSDGVNDNIVVRLSSNRNDITVSINGTQVRSYDKDDVERIQIKGRNGNDTLRIQHDRGNIKAPVYMIGGSGDDKLLAGNEAVHDLRGGDGDDFIDGRGVMRGGAGDDEFDGSNFKDWIFGDDGRDSIDAEGGNDVLFGGDGNDTVEGDRGNDRCFGGDDDDRVEGGRGDDTLFGNAGVDSIFGDDGDDVLYSGGTAEGDILNGNEGDDEENDSEFADIDNLINELEEEADNAV